MIPSINRPTAKILQFPTPARLSSAGLRPGAVSATPFPPRIAPVASGASWYHELAIQEARKDPQR